MNELARSVQLTVELQLGAEASLDTNLLDELDADSFDVMNIVAILEEQHDVVISEEAAARVRTIRDLVELVEAQSTPSP